MGTFGDTFGSALGSQGSLLNQFNNDINNIKSFYQNNSGNNGLVFIPAIIAQSDTDIKYKEFILFLLILNN